jgi:hypothetical protein
MRHIAVVNESKKVTLDQARLMTEACNIQLTRHAAPAWGKVTMPVIFYELATMVPKDGDLIVLLDSPDEADALGYHTETPDGRVYGRVFVNPVLDAGGTILKGALSVSCVLSHEVLEQFIDPDINLWADDGRGKLYAIEVADPVENDAYNVKVGTKPVAVSDFVFPEWFDRENRRGTRYNQLATLKGPFTMRTGGYVVLRNEEGKEKTVFAAKYPAWRKKGKLHEAARTARRAA